MLLLSLAFDLLSNPCVVFVVATQIMEVSIICTPICVCMKHVRVYDPILDEKILQHSRSWNW